MGAINRRDDEPGEALSPVACITGAVIHVQPTAVVCLFVCFLVVFFFIAGGHITLWLKGLKVHLRELRGELMPQLIERRMDAALTVWIKAFRC